jgi:hypothetical protein
MCRERDSYLIQDLMGCCLDKMALAIPPFPYIHLALMHALKGHGNEADFLGFLQKLVPHRSLTLPFEPFRFWLRIRGDIRN